MFNSHGEPVGAQITNYLLEKGRVVGQIENERDFHIFYQFTKGADDNQRGEHSSIFVKSLNVQLFQRCLACKDLRHMPIRAAAIVWMLTASMTLPTGTRLSSALSLQLSSELTAM